MDPYVDMPPLETDDSEEDTEGVPPLYTDDSDKDTGYGENKDSNNQERHRSRESKPNNLRQYNQSDEDTGYGENEDSDTQERHGSLENFSGNHNWEIENFIRNAFGPSATAWSNPIEQQTYICGCPRRGVKMTSDAGKKESQRHCKRTKKDSQRHSKTAVRKHISTRCFKMY